MMREQMMMGEEEEDQGHTDSYRVATGTTSYDDNRTAVGQIKSLRRIPITRGASKSTCAASTLFDIECLRQEMNIDDHRVPLHDLFNRLLTDPNTGMSEPQARAVLTRDGPNTINADDEIPEWVRFCKNIFGGFSLLLWLGAFLCFAHYSLETGMHAQVPIDDLALGAALIIVILITGVFSFYQEHNEVKMIKAFDRLLPDRATVIRDGMEVSIETKDLVVGDIATIKMGDLIAADIRLFDTKNFKVDNSTLTGESEPKWRSPEYTHEDPFLTENLVFNSTFCVEGWAKGIVINTANLTVVGRLATHTAEAEKVETPISQEVSQFIHIITVASIIIGCFLFVVAFILGYFWIDALIFLIGIIVACVPEGMLAIVTIALSLTAKRMSNKNCLVKNLEAVETLGATSILMTDKTGTITSNKLTIAHIWIDNQIGEIDTFAVENPAVSFDKISHSWKNLARVAVLCNNAEFAMDGQDEAVMLREVIGNPKETALLRCIEACEGNVGMFRQLHRTVCDIPFNPMTKIHVSVHECSDFQSNGYLACMIGAPELVLQRCSTALVAGQDRTVDKEYRNAFMFALNEMANMGETVIALADGRLPAKKFPPGFAFNPHEVNFPITGYRMIGLMSMIDPPRPSVPDAVARARAAGVKIIMLTGDHPNTALAIAKSVGIMALDADPITLGLNGVPGGNVAAGIVTGEDLEKMSPDLVDDILIHCQELVFGRIKPEQKLQLVESCQRLGAVVAVTGDGVNDAPAIKRADVGIAMGATGSPYTTKVADILLLDDNFASIVTGIEEGRLMYDNLKKCLIYALSSNIPQLSAFMLSLIVQLPLPLGILGVLVIDLGTDLLPAISLAYEEAEEDVMKRRPRNPINDHLLNDKVIFLAFGQLGLIEAAAGFFTYFVIMAENGFWPSKLVGIRTVWDSRAINDVKDSYGQEWTYDDRKNLEFTCQAGYLFSVVIVQWATLIQTKAKRLSVIQMSHTNWVLNFAIVFETLVAFIIIYVPGNEQGFQLAPLAPLWLLPGFGFFLVMMGYEELRKAISRKHKGCWLDTETQY